tara:strand:+ start:404 stop:598 length:195 start_codon:yes stop_codon:yes gene_type:complete
MTNQNTTNLKDRIRDIQLSIKDKEAELDTLFLEPNRDEEYIEFVQRELRHLYIELDDCYLLYDK